jgi:hypothetical protein
VQTARPTPIGVFVVAATTATIAATPQSSVIEPVAEAGTATSFYVPFTPSGVPTDASALAISLTAVKTRSNGFFSAYAIGNDQRFSHWYVPRPELRSPG